MRIIFLDFDGVLNTEDFLLEQFSARLKNKLPIHTNTIADSYQIKPRLVANLNGILDLTGAKVVVSSTWRDTFNVQELQQILGLKGFDGEIIGVTDSNGVERYHEIQRWIDNEHENNNRVDSFVILDDMTNMNHNMGHLKDHLVKINPEIGLSDLDVLAASCRLIGKQRS